MLARPLRVAELFIPQPEGAFREASGGSFKQSIRSLCWAGFFACKSMPSSCSSRNADDELPRCAGSMFSRAVPTTPTRKRPAACLFSRSFRGTRTGCVTLADRRIIGQICVTCAPFSRAVYSASSFPSANWAAGALERHVTSSAKLIPLASRESS